MEPLEHQVLLRHLRLGALPGDPQAVDSRHRSMGVELGHRTVLGGDLGGAIKGFKKAVKEDTGGENGGTAKDDEVLDRDKVEPAGEEASSDETAEPVVQRMGDDKP